MRGRRRFLASLLAWLPWAAIGPTTAGRAEAVDASMRLTLDAVADTIVPRDADPGAVDVGVPARILARLTNDPDGQRLYREGLAVVEAMARRGGAVSFRALDPTAREGMLLSLGRGDEPARRFYQRVRRDVLSLYWASAAGQRTVGYRPLREGYPDYAEPPATSRTRPR